MRWEEVSCEAARFEWPIRAEATGSVETEVEPLDLPYRNEK